MDKTLIQVPLAEFFRERVQQALTTHNIAASPHLEFYVVNLLGDFKKSEALFVNQGAKIMEQPLALLLAKAVDGDGATKIRCLKKIGDIALYTAGFFSECVQKKLSLDYYVQMGGGAYSNLSGILTTQKTFAELYQELSQLFPDLVKVLADIAIASDQKTPQDLIRLYERWLATGNDTLRKTLEQAGINTRQGESLLKTQ